MPPEPTPAPAPTPTPAPAPAPDPSAELAALKARNIDLENQLKARPAPAPAPDDRDLQEKARLQREADDKKSRDTKALENALRFGMKSQEFLDVNKDLLPKDIGDIFKAAEKENYASVVEKDAAIKAGMIQSFFAVQTNVDLLTPGLRASLDEYLKLTKNGKQEKAQQVYDSIFEPAFDTLKRVKKAEALAKGYSPSDDTDTAYKNKMQAISKSHYLGEK